MTRPAVPALTVLDELDQAHADRLYSSAKHGEWQTVAAERVPQLTAALRAVEALADDLERQVQPRSFHPAGTHSDGASQANAAAADRIRTAITTALEATP